MRKVPAAYDFQERVKEQKGYFLAFVQWLECRTAIQEVWTASRDEDRNQGIDLWARNSAGEKFSIQVKVDFWAQTTRNLVFEVISQARSNKDAVLGWGFKTCADYLVFVIAGPGDIYIFDTAKYTGWVIEHYATLTNFTSPNKSYKTLGCKVPITRVWNLCLLCGNLDDFNPASLQYERHSPFTLGEED